MATIPGLYNTGYGIAVDEQDLNYPVTLPDSRTIYGYKADDSSYPMTAWGGQDSTSQWITPNPDQGYTLGAGYYSWKLSFDLTGYSESTASLTGRVKADNICQVYLNGSQILSYSGFPSWTEFSANSGFIPGINILDFVVENTAASPSGLRVEFTSSSIGASSPNNVLMFSCNT